MNREDALKELRYMLNVDISLYGKKNNPKPNREALEFAIKFLESEKPKGEWIENKGKDIRDHFYTCSICGRTINVICGETLADYLFCHCGADMRTIKDVESDK